MYVPYPILQLLIITSAGVYSVIMLNNLKTGIIYRNPHPHLKSIHAYFPSVAVLGNGDLLATMVLGEAFEAGLD